MIGTDADGGWVLIRQSCPACKRLVLHLLNGTAIHQVNGQFAGVSPNHEKRTLLVHPKNSSRPPCPQEVPQRLAKDYVEACRVLSDSPQSAAALARRCLQNLLREAAKVKPGNLADEIQQVIDSGKLPSHLIESIDAIRNVGNFAAHPMKSQHSGEILEVEVGEAEWNLDVLDSLFDFYFVQPEILKKKRAALDKKLHAAGKPPMK